ncbi:sensor histidine kinase [Sphingomonas hankyongi]|uniref:histidine kinase n=1 Tax=Sphingomonas hankyongi TaxID=2908209 RepID=A0ABT0S3I7_9SPHN|nr:HAMP domain-containing sensor histidine kinase [Sphingomonas hankyongi]MCL6730434.1 HAMP domain-containing histidine kinase [Sphingomonas hankyongi]
MFGASLGAGHSVRFDDRLLTVLNHSASDRHDAAVRWRQLVDLVARAGPNSSSPVVVQALEAIRDGSNDVDEPLRAAAARAVAALPLPLGLLECFAADKLSVSAPVLAAAKLDPSEWETVLRVADSETRHFVEALHPQIGAEKIADLTDSLVEPAGPVAETYEEPVAGPSTDIPVGPSLSEVVARIERRRRKRATQPPSLEATPGTISIGTPSLFRWECGPSGEIVWVEGAPRGALIGRSVARAQEIEGDTVEEDVVRAFAMRAPFRDGSFTIGGDGLVSGDWKISGIPAFDPADGRFAGYRGIALRTEPPRREEDAADTLLDPDSLRELVHEIKTPLNAIIGFAEIIDGQYLGPADRRYRERAADIVAEARLLLGAIDDLDFAAKVHSASDDSARRVDMAELIERASPSLRALASDRGADMEIALSSRVPPIAVEPELADRLIYRFCSAMIDAASAGERLRLSIDQSGDQCRLSVSRPVALKGLAEARLFDPGQTKEPEGTRIAFSLKLIRGLARIAGGDLVTSRAGLSLTFRRA